MKQILNLVMKENSLPHGSYRQTATHFLLVIICLFSLFGCNAKNTQRTFNPTPRTMINPDSMVEEETSVPPTPSPTVTQTSTATLIPSTPTATLDPKLLDPGYNPLTGLIIDDPSLLERRPVMVKVSNWPRLGRPHAGLSSADIVFEYYIGAQMNRFLAIYYGENANTIGPVRSGRLVDAQLANLYQGLLVYGDADPNVDKVLIEVLGERAMAFHNLPCPAICGQATHSATGVFANSTEISKYANTTGIENTHQTLDGMFFQETPGQTDEMGTLVSFVYADFSLTEWRYFGETGEYNLWQDAELQDGKIGKSLTVDRNSDLPVSFENIIILFTNYVEYTPSLHDIELTYSSTYQSALFFRDGMMTYGSWYVQDPTKPLAFIDNNGEDYKLKPGQSWIYLAGNHTITEQVKPGEWDFYFNIP